MYVKSICLYIIYAECVVYDIRKITFYTNCEQEITGFPPVRENREKGMVREI